MDLIILQAQSATSAAIEIILMLLGAAIIGIVTTYLYLKSKYEKQISILDSHIEEQKKIEQELRNEIDDLKNDLASKQDQLHQAEHEKSVLKDENDKLKKEYEALKSLYEKLTEEVENFNVKLHEQENELKEKDAVLQRIAQRKHLLDYESFGRATEGDKDDLKMVSGIGPFIEEKLNMLDIFTFEQISKFTKKDIETVNEAIEYFPGRIERDQWVVQAKELAKTGGRDSELLEKIRSRRNKINYTRIGKATKEEADDLTVISGIGGWILHKLNALDIYTYKQIANFTEEDEKSVTEAIEFFPGRIDRDEWVLQAKELVYSGGKKTALFERMKLKKHKINYSKIGVAHKEDAQDLSQIHGIGPFIQEKLNFLGIYTFEQISKFTKTDIETVADIIEFFPGRIVRDKWVSQAKALVKKSKGK